MGHENGGWMVTNKDLETATKPAEESPKAKRASTFARDYFTDASQTVQLEDGTYAFCGEDGYYRDVLVMIPGYDFVYGQATASAEHTNAHDAVRKSGVCFPQGSVLRYRNKVVDNG